MGWLEETRDRVRALPREFTSRDLYRFVPELSRKWGDNNFIPDQLRKQLQRLRDRGEIEFLGDGRYRSLIDGPFSDWPLSPGDVTDRTELAKILRQSGTAGLERGMFKAAMDKPFSRDLLLFHSESSNPYGDRILDDGTIIYIGEGKQAGVDQKMQRNNAHLANHLDEGTRVHFFVQPKKENRQLEYRGRVVLDSYQPRYRAEEGRRIFEFVLKPLEEGTAPEQDYGHDFVEIASESLDPHESTRGARWGRTRRFVRDAAFSSHLSYLYGSSCAVCGDVLTGAEKASGERRMDLQGAHIKSVSAGGPDALNNGVAMCARHHWAFDSGVFSLTDSLEVVLRAGYKDPHRELQDGTAIAGPRDDSYWPHAAYLNWHRHAWSLA